MSEFNKDDREMLSRSIKSGALENVLGDDSNTNDLIDRYSVHGGDGRYGYGCVYDSFTNMHDACGVVRLVRDICSNNYPCFTIQTLPRCFEFVNRNVAAHLQLMLVNQIHLGFFQYPDVRLAPEVDVFIQCVEQAIADGLDVQYPSPDGSVEDFAIWVQTRNKLVDHIRLAAAEFTVARRRQSQLRRIRKNLKAVLTGMVASFQRHSKILALRFDVGFHKITEHPQQNPKIDFATVDAARQKLLAHIRKRFGAALIWYVWKLEFGAEKGFHLHWLVFVNGSVHSHDGHLVKELGEFWNTQVVPGQGVYFNCSTIKQRYKSCSIGQLDADNPGIWQGLGYIAEYVTKLDYFVQSRVASKRRTLGMGVVKPKKGEKPGPKRRSSLVLPADVYQIVYGR